MYNKKQCIQLVLDANKLVIIDQKSDGNISIRICRINVIQTLLYSIERFSHPWQNIWLVTFHNISLEFR